jgi:hypothetical protein
MIRIFKDVHDERLDALGRHTVDGTARTIGVDPEGNLAVWFETGETSEYLILWTGDPLPEGWRLAGSTVWLDLVWHLAVRR